MKLDILPQFRQRHNQASAGRLTDKPCDKVYSIIILSSGINQNLRTIISLNTSKLGIT